MNLVGKIFVGVIALMSVVCLTLSVVSYASHHNWKEKSVELSKQLDDAKKQQQLLLSQKSDLESRISSEKQSYLASVEALTTKVNNLEQNNQLLLQKNDELQADLDNRLAIIETNNVQIGDLRQQLSVASDDLANAQQLRATYLQDLARTMEKLHELSATNGDLNEKNADLVQLYDEALTVLNQNGLSSDPADYGDLPQFAVQGTVEVVREGNDGLLMISIGSDDGLTEHNKLNVRRGDSYLGKIEVVTLEPNRAVCKVLPEYRQGVIMEGDDVYSQNF
ncbi:MAG: hypothetical protein KIG81_00385 [Thermoguttaceae bacterium]|nr:hypothetical protein [Thermoguttaceae bacterium]